MVLPKAKLPGSTSVRCWLLEFVKESQLNSISGTLAGTKVEPAVQVPEVICFRAGFGSEPQPGAMRMHKPKTIAASPRIVRLPRCPDQPLHINQGHLRALGTKYREA